MGRDWLNHLEGSVRQPKPFQYKVRKNLPDPGKVDRVQPDKLQETFTGELQGMKASDIEERFARALNKRNIGYEFRVAYIAGRNLPGEVELDFAVSQGSQIFPVQIDGEFAHKSASQKSEDAMKDAILNQRLEGMARPVIRIPGAELETQEMTDRKVKELFG